MDIREHVGNVDSFAGRVQANRAALPLSNVPVANVSSRPAVDLQSNAIGGVYGIDDVLHSVVDANEVLYAKEMLDANNDENEGVSSVDDNELEIESCSEVIVENIVTHEEDDDDD